MARYSGVVKEITPVTTDDNWALDAATAGDLAKILEVHWGGFVTTSTAMTTRVTRPTTAGTVPVAGTAAVLSPFHTAANKVEFVTGWTAQPVLAADEADLFTESWNAHGGVVRWLAAPGEEFIVTFGLLFEGISCRNLNGVAASTYGTIWEED